MNIKLARFLLLSILLSPLFSDAQKGKDSDYVVTASNTIVNTYTYLTANTAIGATSITVNSNSMSGGAFAGNLAAGDLIMIIQMQGASMDIDTLKTTSPTYGGWGGNFTNPIGYFWDDFWLQDVTKVAKWGQVTSYNNAGKFQQVEVSGVSGGNTINLNCGLQNAYTATGHVQIIRIPRFNNLTLNASTTIVPTIWNGQIGGVVAVEVNGNLILNTSSKISATARGFRGAVADNVGNIGTTTPHTNGDGNGGTQMGSKIGSEGARKGEGIGGFTPEYTVMYSAYGRGAPANGGGGGGYQNAGGGGGANVGSGTYTGKGVPSSAYAVGYWNIELAGFATSSSPGGGRGGYSLSSSDQNALTLKPNSSAWSADARKENGGLGGHPLAYDATRLFMGGGGGAGDQDQNQGGAGGIGGGIVFVTCYGTISGSGTFESDGGVGQNTNPAGQSPGFGQKKGNDGAGGGGAGGSIYIKNSTAIPATITTNARGGNGGNHNLSLGIGASSEASGPGGGGSGGNIAFTSGTPVMNVGGGTNGTTNSSQLSEFLANGATNGAAGVTGLAAPTFNITASNTTICSGSTATLTAVVTGTLPGTLTWYSQQFGGSSIGTGTTYTTPVLTNTTTYYVGVCPGTFRIPVVVTVNPNPLISGTAVLTNPTCSNPGSITGLTVSGGTPNYTYNWSGTITTGPDYTNIPAGNYTLTVTDLNNCTDTDGPHTLVGTSGPIINQTNQVVVDQNCNGTMGSISGITVTGTGLIYSWSNGGGAALNASNLAAGTYTLTVTDGNGCVANSTPITVGFVSGPTVNVSGIVITPATCGNANGSILGITATGSGLSYTWNAVSNPSLDLSNQLGGSYTLVVTDGNGCSVSSGPHVINSVAGPTISAAAIIITPESCNQANGSITGLSINGGTPLFSIVWTGTIQTTLDITSLSAGNYSLTVTDQNGCVATSGPYTILNTGSPVLNETNVVVTDQNCNGTMGSINGITATGTGLIYSWSNSGGTTLNASNLLAGTYTLTVTDGNGCTAISNPYTVNYISGPTVNASGIVITPATCGNANGSISGITATGSGLSYTWNAVSNPSLDLSNQLGGNYTLVVTDGNGCSVSSGPHVINSVAGPTISATSLVITPENCNQANGSVVGLTINGGTPVYTLVWTGTAQTTLDITNLTAGSYSLTVTDQNGCVATSGPHVVNNAGGPSLNESNAITSNELCDGTLGSINGITASGTGLNYAWSNGGGNALNAANLSAGSYQLTVTDGNGCSITSAIYTINAPIALSINTTNMLVTPTSCTANTGSISGIVLVGGINPTASWSNSASTLDISNLSAGNYILTATDDQGCTETLSVDITMVNAPIIDTNNMIVSVEYCGQNNASVTGITVSGGTAPYDYVWNSDTSMDQLDQLNVSSGNYNLVVTDSQGCSDMVNFVISEQSASNIDGSNMLVQQVTCTSLGAISGIQINGAGPYTYSWTNTTQATLDITNLSDGSYTLTVTDANGCLSTFTPVVLTQPTGPIANFTWSPNTPAPNDNVVFTNASQGTNIISYSWTILGLDFLTEDTQFAFMEEGEYSVHLEIMDAAGCIDSINQIITIYGEIVIPNVITVNDDNVNDTFEIKGLKPNTSLVVINRWGNVVFNSNDYQNNWNGIDVSGNELLDGVYTYILKGADGKVEHGFVHLIH